MVRLLLEIITLVDVAGMYIRGVHDSFHLKMPLRILTLFWLILLWSTSSGQTCTHKNLSYKFDYTTSVKRYPRTDDVMDSCEIKVSVRKKKTGKLVQAVLVKSGYMLSSDFNNCKDVRSYVTGFNAKRQAVDNNFGSLIVADLNFDGREDVAVKRDAGGNGGPFYDYYIQSKKETFVRHPFLSEEMMYFPTKKNKRRQLLTSYVHAGACAVSEHIYHYQAKTHQWTETNHRIIDVCK